MPCHRALLIASSLVCATMALEAADWPQWRGPARTGISTETGLLREWPTAGPRLVWRIDNVGDGFSTPSVVGDRLYIIANEGMQNELVKALNVADGKTVWSTRIGRVGNPDQQPAYPGARSTPTVDGDTLYALGSDGDLAALDVKTGTIKWKKSLRADFGGVPGTWAYSESPLVDGEKLVVTPGGKTPLVALNKRTGAVIWRAAATGGVLSSLFGGEPAGYASVADRPGGRRPAVRDVPRQRSRGRGRQHGRAPVARRPDGTREPGQHPDAGRRQRHRLPRHQCRRRRRRAADGEAGQGQHAAALCREAASGRDRRQRAGGRHDVRHQQRVVDGRGLRDWRAEVATARYRDSVDRDGRWAAVPARRERRRGAGRGVAHGVSREGAVHAAESAAAPRRRPAHGTVEGLGPSRRRQRAAVHPRPGHHVGVRRPRGTR